MLMHTTNKQIKNAYHQWFNSTDFTLEDCYNTYSYAKQQAWNYCRELEQKYNGDELCIIGYNSQTFSAGFIGEVDGEEAFIYITKTYDRYILLTELD